MTFDQYWKALQCKNAGLANDATKMTISVESFRRSLAQAYERGRDQEKSVSETEKTIDDLMKGLGL